MRIVPKPSVVIPKLSDEDLATFLGIDVKDIPRFSERQRKAYEALHDADRRIGEWRAGRAEKPRDILMDEA